MTWKCDKTGLYGGKGAAPIIKRNVTTNISKLLECDNTDLDNKKRAVFIGKRNDKMNFPTDFFNLIYFSKSN